MNMHGKYGQEIWHRLKFLMWKPVQNWSLFNQSQVTKIQIGTNLTFIIISNINSQKSALRDQFCWIERHMIISGTIRGLWVELMTPLTNYWKSLPPKGSIPFPAQWGKEQGREGSLDALIERYHYLIINIADMFK